MSTAPRPSFFIVGGPKCGTTALYTYLRQHPEVFMPDRKEPHYFCPDLFSPRYVHDEGEYLALFAPGAGVPRIGEASVYYLYSREAARRIHAFAPDGRIIIMLRNPVDMIYSLHSQRLYSGHENLENFEDALAAEGDRRAGRRLSPDPYPIPCLLYRDVGRYAGQVRRFLQEFPREQVHVVFFDDFAHDTAAVFGAVCRFLGIDPGFVPDLDVYNPNKTVRSRALRTLLKFTPQSKTLARRFLPRPTRQRIANHLVRLNTRYEPRQPMPGALRRRLRAEFAPDVDELSALLARDLTSWVSVDQDTARDGAEPDARSGETPRTVRLVTLPRSLGLFAEIRIERILMGRPQHVPVPWQDAIKAALQALELDPVAITDPALSSIETHVAERVTAMQQAGQILGSYNADLNLARACYVLCRGLRPRIVVETGVAFGLTSAFILQALAENGRGELHSIDAPPALMSKELVGSLVPADLRSRWRLRFGTSYDVLPGLLADLGPVDVFLHDSRHTFRVTNWELQQVTPKLAPRAVALVDDIQKNVAFRRWIAFWRPAFAAAIEQQGKKGMFGVGVLRR